MLRINEVQLFQIVEDDLDKSKIQNIDSEKQKK